MDIMVKIINKSLASSIDFRYLRVMPLLQAFFLLGVALLGIVLVIHAALLQAREVDWFRESTRLGEPQAAPLSAPLFPDPQEWDLQARWLALQASRTDDLPLQISLLRRSVDAARRHVQARPQWSMAWLNWARISAQLHPAGREWQAATLRALSLGDHGRAFQRELTELVMRNESFMTPETRSVIERSVLSRMSEDQELAGILLQQSLLSALCAAPVSREARRICFVKGNVR